MSEQEKEESVLEMEFRQVYKEHHDEIKKLVKEADALLDKAVALSERYGIPFDSSVSHICQSYYPQSLTKRWKDLSQDFVEEVSGTYAGEYNYGYGWEHSAVCS